MSVAKKQGDARSEKSRGNGARKAQATALHWINPHPSNSDKDWLESHQEESRQLVFELLANLSAEDTLSVKLDKSSGRWLATLFLYSQETDGVAPAVSVRARDAIDAVTLLAYEHEEVHKAVYEWSSQAPQGRWD